jgi:N-acetyl-gamma-glutamylphosphate reductase
MKLTKGNLLGVIAELVEMLNEYGCNTDTIVETLKQYGFTKDQIEEWYGLEHSGFETYNEAPYGE